MLPLTQFSLPFFDNFEIKGEYEGNKKSGKVIIFSHGFGVKRNSWGMFNEIGDTLKEDNLIIRFDYNKIIPEKNALYLFPPSLQAKMLEQVYHYTRNTFSPFHFTIIAHSMGCVIASQATFPQLDCVILLSPPIKPPYQSIKDYFSQRPNTHFDEQGITRIEKSDGSLNYVPQEFWPEVKSTQPIKKYQKLMTHSSVYAIHPKDDQILSEEPYPQLAKLLEDQYYEIDGNHDFAPPHRQKLLDRIQQIVGGV